MRYSAAADLNPAAPPSASFSSPRNRFTTGASAALLVAATNRPGVYANVRSYGPSAGGLSVASFGLPFGS